MSQQIAIDFVKQSPLALNRLTRVGLLLLLLGLASLMYVLHQADKAQAAYEDAESALAAVAPQQAKKKAVKKTPVKALSEAELRQANKTAAMLDVQWHALFSGLEQLKMRHVALLSIEPNVKKQRLVLTGQAKHMQALLDYVAHIETLPMLSRVHLQKHQVEEETPFKPVSFTIVARWL